MKTLLKLFCISLLVLPLNAIAQNSDKSAKMQWFKDAKLGIFIHWGIYSVNGIPESWSFFNNYISHKDYMKQLDKFTAAKYDPEYWAALIEESGARYSVLSTKHHDGVALWKPKAGGYNVVEHSAAKKDVLTPWVNAMRKYDIKVGLYYSLPDWSYNDYDVFTRDVKRYDINKEPERWNKFTNYFHSQLKELSTTYNPDLYWFDGDWEHSPKEWQADKVREILYKNPNVVINSRLGAGFGDYDTPEQGVPISKPSSKYWELCYTTNDSWGYNMNDDNYKTPSQLIRIFAECVSMGGNLLLAIGPKADGTLPTEQVHILKELGAWNKKHGQAIFGTNAGLPDGHYNGPSSLSADGKSLFLFTGDKPTQELVVKGITAKVNEVNIIGKKQKPSFRTEGDNLYIKLMPQNSDDYVSAVELKLDKPFNAAANLVKPKATSNFDVLNLPEFSGLKNNERWKEKHAEALKAKHAGVPQTCYWGTTALSEDKEVLYLFINGKPNGSLMIKGLTNSINRIRIVGNGTLLNHTISSKLYWSAVPGVVYVDVPEAELDEDVTVIAVLLKGKLDVFTGDSKPIESN